MKRFLVVAVLALIAIAALAAVAAQPVARYVAERQIDQALAQIRKQSTSVANRGAVTVDLRTRIVTVDDVSIVRPGGSDSITIGSITIARPEEADGMLSAERVLLERIAIESDGETISVPSVEISRYSGPSSGLVATPGFGAVARSQAEIIARVSLESAAIPVISSTDAKAGVRRTIRDVKIERVVNGVIDAASVGSLTFDGSASPQAHADDGVFDLSASSIRYRDLRLPALWRVYARDGAGQREKLAGKLSVAALALSRQVADRRTSLAADGFSIDGLEVRPVAFSLAALREIVAKIRGGAAVTPAETRRQTGMAVDAANAFAFDRLAVGALSLTTGADADRRTEFSMGAVEIGPYADGRLAGLTVEKLELKSGVNLSIDRTQATNFDATALAAYAGRVARDEVMMTSEPTTEDIVRTAPRLQGLDLVGARVATPNGGEILLRRARINIDAPLRLVPQRLSVDIDEVDVAPRRDFWLSDAFREASIERLRGSASFVLTLDAVQKTLALDALDYRFEQLGAVTAKGALADVDPLLAVSSGAKLYDRVTAIVLEPFKFTLKDGGAVETFVRKWAEKSRAPVEEFREAAAREAERAVIRLFGPDAATSGVALAAFLREPRSIEVTVNPRTSDVSLIAFIDALGHSPEAIAQTIDIAVLYRR